MLNLVVRAEFMTSPPAMIRLFRFALPMVALLCSLLGNELRSEEREELPLSADLVGLSSEAGMQLLSECNSRRDFHRLSMYFECQVNPGYCGPASISMVCNASGQPRPISTHHPSYRLFDQKNIFAGSGDPPKAAANVRRSGMSLQTLASHFDYLGLDTQRAYASDFDAETLRKLVQDTLASEKSFMVVNYHRSILKQIGGGHISPIAAYHQETDRVLILDVAKYKYPPVWVELSTLHAAMKSRDGAKSRGLVIVTARDPIESRK